MSEENNTPDAVDGTEQTLPETKEEVKKTSRKRAPRKKLSIEEIEASAAQVDELIKDEEVKSPKAKLVTPTPEVPRRKRKPVDRNAYRRIKKFNGRIDL